jgi:hypothetical protein
MTCGAQAVVACIDMGVREKHTTLTLTDTSWAPVMKDMVFPTANVHQMPSDAPGTEA